LSGLPRLDVLIAGGGTGGHVFPALALGSALLEQGLSVEFAGSPSGLEARLVPAAGRTLHLIPGRQMRGGGVRGAVTGATALGRGVASGLALVRRLRPGLVVGVGGYASVASVLAARLRRVPVVLLEQNAIAGAANRSLGRFARRICVGFAEAARFFPPGRAVHTGNPIRPEVLAAPQGAQHHGPGLLIFGGSQGAHHLNEASIDALERIGSRAASWRIRHQTGTADLAEVSAAYRRLELPARVEAFVDDMGGAYREADVVGARSGAMSCAEITAMGLPSLLVPYPWAADDHQRRNAEILVEGDAARMVLDRDLDGAWLADGLTALLDDDVARAAMAARARELGRPDAAERVAAVCLAILRGRPT